jgi:imidazolonepropionase-like amidohydrolase
MSVWLWLTVALAQDLAIRGATVHPVAGPPIEAGVVLIEDGKIAAVGPELSIPEGTRVIEGAVVTPGLVDGLTVAGLSGVQNQGQDQDHREQYDAVLPELRALDAYNPRDALVHYLRDFGVTTVQAGPSPGAPVGGRTLVASTHAGSADEAALLADGAVLFSLGEAAKQGPEGRGRMGAAATIRQALTEARDYRERRKLRGADKATQDLGLDALVEVLDGTRRAVFHAHRADDIQTALRIGTEFGFTPQIAGGSDAWLLTEELAAAEVPVLLGPVMARSWYEGERRHANFEAAKILTDGGVDVGFLGGYEAYVPKVRVVGFEASIAAGNGLGMTRALEAVTLTNARLLGVEDAIGSLEVGKRADIVVWDGDPFETTSHACFVVVAGEVASETCH